MLTITKRHCKILALFLAWLPNTSEPRAAPQNHRKVCPRHYHTEYHGLQLTMRRQVTRECVKAMGHSRAASFRPAVRRLARPTDNRRPFLLPFCYALDVSVPRWRHKDSTAHRRLGESVASTACRSTGNGSGSHDWALTGLESGRELRLRKHLALWYDRSGRERLYVHHIYSFSH